MADRVAALAVWAGQSVGIHARCTNLANAPASLNFYIFRNFRLTIPSRIAHNAPMLQFLPTHINCLETQVEAYATATTMNRVDVEELMSIFVSLAGELEKSLANEQLSGSPLSLGDFSRLAAIGGRIRGMATRLRKDGHTLAGIDPFVRSVIRCRDIAHSDQNSAGQNPADCGEMTSRRGDEVSSPL
jgi:hypothetical protein